MNSMPEPTTSAAAAGLVAKVGAGALAKLGAMAGAGLVGAAIMAAFDPPASRKELFGQAAAAAAGSMIFGGPAVRTLDYYATFVDLGVVDIPTYFEWAVPVYFIVGALSWGAFAALAKLRGMIRDKAADAVYNKFKD